MAPHEVDAAAEAGDVSPEHVVEAYLLELADPFRGAAVYEWLHREALEASRKRAEEARLLVDQIRGCADPERRAALMARLAELEAG